MSSLTNTTLSLRDVLKILQEAVEQEGSFAALAAEMGLSRSYVADVVRGAREPGRRILACLNLEKTVERVVTYRVKKQGRV